MLVFIRLNYMTEVLVLMEKGGSLVSVYVSGAGLFGV